MLFTEIAQYISRDLIEFNATHELYLLKFNMGS